MLIINIYTIISGVFTSGGNASLIKISPDITHYLHFIRYNIYRFYDQI